MKKSYFTRYLTAVCFILFIGFIFLYTSAQFLHVCQSKLFGGTYEYTLKEFFTNYQVPGKSAYITLNGGLQRLLGAREINGRYRLDNGHLTYVMPQLDTSVMADNTLRFCGSLSELDIPFLYVSAPFKIAPEDKELPPSISDYSNENADNFLAVLRDSNVPVLDLREAEKEDKLNHYDLFYLTDHHWTAETGFWACNKIVEYLSAQDASWKTDPILMDLTNYRSVVYPKIMLGSAGRRTGRLYAGRDDISVVSPEFDTDLCFSVPGMGIMRCGTYDETVLFPERLTEGDDFSADRYSVYCGDEYALLSTENRSAVDDLSVKSTPKRLLVIKDSFCTVVAPFLSLCYDEVNYIDLRLFGDDLMSYIKEYDPDMVMVIYNPGAYEKNNRNMFEFIKD